MSLNLVKKTFKQLTADDIYRILNIRLEVFLMEQNIVYVDTDFYDQKCIHYYFQDDKQKIVSYLRVIPKGIKYREVSIGRVATLRDFRGQKLGQMLIEAVQKDLQGEPIRISAQAYLKTYYESLGFIEVSDTYIEEGILHMEMLYQPQK